jgi:signal transduction histidine kinase
LGLAVTKTVVEEHQGSIEVRSEPHQGAEFRVKLPAADSKAELKANS